MMLQLAYNFNIFLFTYISCTQGYTHVMLACKWGWERTLRQTLNQALCGHLLWHQHDRTTSITPPPLIYPLTCYTTCGVVRYMRTNKETYWLNKYLRSKHLASKSISNNVQLPENTFQRKRHITPPPAPQKIGHILSRLFSHTLRVC